MDGITMMGIKDLKRSSYYCTSRLHQVVIMKVLSLFLLCSSCTALSVSRRKAFEKAAALSGLVFLPTSAAVALESCPPGSQKCIRTTWTPPQGASKADIVSSIMSVINDYPQEGQAGVDNRGYTVVEDTLSDKNIARVEYRNFGNFAKIFNGGKPFVDDLTIELDDNNIKQVQIRSASRIGDSDLGVNKKRLQYLGQALQAKGWTVPEPTY
jgi:hypothetical protein